MLGGRRRLGAPGAAGRPPRAACGRPRRPAAGPERRPPLRGRAAARWREGAEPPPAPAPPAVRVTKLLPPPRLEGLQGPGRGSAGARSVGPRSQELSGSGIETHRFTPRTIPTITTCAPGSPPPLPPWDGPTPRWCSAFSALTSQFRRERTQVPVILIFLCTQVFHCGVSYNLKISRLVG